MEAIDLGLPLGGDSDWCAEGLLTDPRQQCRSIARISLGTKSRRKKRGRKFDGCEEQNVLLNLSRGRRGTATGEGYWRPVRNKIEEEMKRGRKKEKKRKRRRREREGWKESLLPTSLPRPAITNRSYGGNQIYR
jgi:hypothetical protein